MSFPILGSPKPAFFDSSGSPLVNGTLSILEPSDDTDKASYPTYDDAEALMNANVNPIVLDSRGEPPNGFFGIDGQKYKLVLKDANGTTIWTVDDIATWNGDFGSVANGHGASLIGVEDSASNFAATDVEAALAEIIADYAAVTNGNGASKIGVEDAAGNLTATDVEAALAEIFAASSTGSFTATLTGFSADPSTPTVRWSKEGLLVTILFNFATGTSNATTWTITNLPSALTPPRGQVVPITGLHDNGSDTAAAGVVLISGTTLTFGLDGTNANTGGGFTGSAAKGFSAGTSIITYSLMA